MTLFCFSAENPNIVEGGEKLAAITSVIIIITYKIKYKFENCSVISKLNS